MTDKLNDMMTGIYGFSVRDNKVVPPKHHFPKAVAERADYFWEMAEDGLTLMGGWNVSLRMINLKDMIFGQRRSGYQKQRNLMSG